jgi:ribosomal protein S6
MAELDRSLHLADEVLRHKVIRLPDSVAAAATTAATPVAGAEANGA